MERTPRNISILIPDSDDHKNLALQVINCLSLIKEVKIYIVSSNKHSYLKFSRYVSHFSYYPKLSDENWVDHINLEVEKYSIDFILPVFEFGIRKLIELKDSLIAKDKLSILPSLMSFDTARDKGLLYQHLKTHGFPCPESVVTKPHETPNLSHLEFPMIAKPVIGFGGGQQIKVLNTIDDVENYRDSISFSCNTIYQNFIYGYDLCCNVLCKKGEVIAYSIQTTSIFKKKGVTPQAGFSFVQEHQLLELVKNVMKSLEWSGVANIDCRYDERDDNFKIIEINTRYWINVDASAVAKVNFPYLHCLLTLNKDIVIPEALNIFYLNLKGLVKEVTRRPAIMFRVNYLKNNTPLLFALKDPAPMVYKFVWRTKNIILNKFKSA